MVIDIEGRRLETQLVETTSQPSQDAIPKIVDFIPDRAKDSKHFGRLLVGSMMRIGYWSGGRKLQCVVLMAAW